MVDALAIWIGYVVLFGSLAVLACVLWAWALVALMGLIKTSFRSIRFYYRFLCWHKCKAKVEAWIATDEGREMYKRIAKDSKAYEQEVSKNDKILDQMFP